MLLPNPRGPITCELQQLRGAAPDADLGAVAAVAAQNLDGDPGNDDAQLALWALYELHYCGFDDVESAHEWSPDLIAARRLLERRFESQLRELAAPRVEAAITGMRTIADRVFGMVANDNGPQLASYVQRSMTRPQLHELLIHRSVYHLKEADPHTFAIPRLQGAAKAALVEIQFDEYGGGRAEEMHSALFAGTMRKCGLDDTYGAYIPNVPGYTLAVSNAMSLFGLHRRLRAAAAGHLAAFEATSSLPNRRYAAGVRRLGYGDAAARYFDEHVEADAVHEQVAVREMCGALVASDPGQLENVLFGAAACLALDAHAAEQQLTAWRSGGSSLRSARDLDPCDRPPTSAPPKIAITAPRRSAVAQAASG